MGHMGGPHGCIIEVTGKKSRSHFLHTVIESFLERVRSWPSFARRRKRPDLTRRPAQTAGGRGSFWVDLNHLALWVLEVPPLLAVFAAPPTSVSKV